MDDKNRQKQTKKPFKYQAYHSEAVELRYAGDKYEEIAEKLTEKYKKDFKNARIRTWFAAGGILEIAYMDYAKKENARRRGAMLEELKKLTPIIPKKYMELLTERKTTDKDGKVVPKLDAVTRATLKDLCELFGFKMSGDGEGITDPVDEFFDRVREEIKNDDAENEKNNPKNH